MCIQHPNHTALCDVVRAFAKLEGEEEWDLKGGKPSEHTISLSILQIPNRLNSESKFLAASVDFGTGSNDGASRRYLVTSAS